MDTRDLVKRQFGAHAINYVKSPDHSRGESLDRLIAVVKPQPGWRALDVATGGGHTALALAPLVREVVAADLTPEMLAAAEGFVRGRGAANVVFREADAEDLPFGEGEFDLVTCRIAPHHFPDPAHFVRECARVVGPGGLVAVIDNITPPDSLAARHINAVEKLRDPSHVWACTAAEWESFFANAGLAVEHAELFTKARDFHRWADMMSVPPKVKLQLEVLLRQAPAPALEALRPREEGDRFVFELQEVLIVGRTHPFIRSVSDDPFLPPALEALRPREEGEAGD